MLNFQPPRGMPDLRLDEALPYFLVTPFKAA